MKKFTLALSLCGLIYAGNIQVQTMFSTVKFNYKEYQNSYVFDEEVNNFFDLKGVKFSIYDSFNKFKIGLDTEYHKGSTTYKGQTWDGTPLELNRNNVYLLNVRTFADYLIKSGKTTKIYIGAGIGYRRWNRGKSDYEGDYDEKYKWKYYLLRLSVNKDISKFNIGANISYHRAISPKLKAELGNGVTYDLGVTDGYRIEFPIKYNITKNYGVMMEYAYDYWRINPSSIEYVNLNGNDVATYEPESKTRNQYLNIGIFYNF